MYVYIYIYIYICQSDVQLHKHRRGQSGGTKRATSMNRPLLRLQSSEGEFTMSRKIEPVRRSFCRHGSCTFTELARLVPSGHRNT